MMIRRGKVVSRDRARPMEIYYALLGRFGFRHWWPGETAFEIFVGAMLTQNTSWNNVEKAISCLRESDSLGFDAVSDMKIAKLERLIHSSGFYKQKAKRLRDICTSIRNDFGSLNGLFQNKQDELRKILLDYNGIGNETANSIILYAAGKPSFVIDAYTKRIMSRLDSRFSGYDYMQLKNYFEGKIERNVRLYKDFHAQFVELGKRHCKTTPICVGCPLAKICSYGRSRH